MYLGGTDLWTHINHRGAGPHGTVGSTSDSRARGHGFNIRSGHILSFLLLLTQEGQ